MRIALCLSGQPRSYKAGFEYYKKNLLSKYQVDVFIHTWDSPDTEDYLTTYVDYLCRTKVDEPLGRKYDSKYTHTPNAEKWPPSFTVSALYSTFQCNLMRIEQEVDTKQYDWVVKTRSDFALPVVIPFEQLEKGKLYMPMCRKKAFGDWLGNDQFAIGDSDVMNKYMSTYLNMERYYNAGVEMIGEEMLRANLVENGLVNRNLSYLDMPEPFPPGPHNGTPHFLIRDDYDKWTNSSKN